MDVVVVASELLREAEKLMSLKIHPQTTILGANKAVKAAFEHSTPDYAKMMLRFKRIL